MSFMLGGLITKAEIVLGNVGDILASLFLFIFFGLLIILFAGVAFIGVFLEGVFQKVAGLDTIYVDGTAYGVDENGQDLIYAFITNQEVQDVFFAVVALSFVLLFIFTIIALIRSEFVFDMKGNAKGPILGRALRSLANFIIVPTATIIAILGMNFVTKSVYKLSNEGESSIATQCFMLGAHDANRVRNNETFYKQLVANDYYANVTDNGNKSLAIYTGEEPTIKFSQYKDEETGQKALARAIDDAFSSMTDLNVVFAQENLFYAILNDEINDPENTQFNWFTLIFGQPKTSTCTITAPVSINFFYDIAEFDYILGLGSIIVMAWTLFGLVLVLVKRVFELTILFIVSPVPTAIAPLDGGQAEKKWRQEVLKRLVAVVVPVFAINMYYLLIPIFKNISLFGDSEAVASISSGIGTSTMLGSAISEIKFFSQFYNVFDIFFQTICILTGLSIVKSASGMLSGLLGVDDLIKNASENTKKAIDSGKKAFSLATSVSGVAIKGTAFALKAGKAPFSALAGKKQRDEARNQLGDAESERNSSKEYLDEQKDNLKSAEDTLKNDKEYQNAKKEFEEKSSAGMLTDKDRKKYQDMLSNNDAYKSFVSAKEAKEQAEERYDNANKIYESRKSGISADAQEKIEAQEKILEDENTTEEQKKKAQKEINKLQRKGLSFGQRIDDAYNSEFGENADETSFMAGVANSINKAVQGNKVIKKIPLLKGRLPKTTNSMKEYFAVNGDTAVRRLNDAMAGVFGEGGGAELWKINFNKNARASLYEGVPESKKREQGIQQGLLSEARDKYTKGEEEKKEKKAILNEIKRMRAGQMSGGEGYNQIIKRIEEAQKIGDKKEVVKLEAEKVQFEEKTGLNSYAESYYGRLSKNREEYQAFKDKLDHLAAVDAAKKAQEDREKAQQIAEETGIHAEQKSAGGGAKETNTKISEDSLAKLKEAIQGALKETSAKEIGVLKEVAESMKSSADLSNVLAKLVEAISKLDGKGGNGEK